MPFDTIPELPDFDIQFTEEDMKNMDPNFENDILADDLFIESDAREPLTECDCYYCTVDPDAMVDHLPDEDWAF